MLTLTLIVASAFAGDPAPAPAAPPPVADAPAATAPVDCTTLTGDAKTECEKKAAEATTPTPAAPAAPVDAGKGSKARSTGNRMEAEATDE